MKRYFITGAGSADSDEVYGDFEDLENGGTGSSNNPSNPDNSASGNSDEPTLEQKKEALKRKFDSMYDDEEDDETSRNLYDNAKDEFARQSQVNRLEFEGDDDELRAQVEGRRAGAYVRIILENMPYEFVECLNPAYHVIVGGLLPSEETFGFSHVCR